MAAVQRDDSKATSRVDVTKRVGDTHTASKEAMQSSAVGSNIEIRKTTDIDLCPIKCRGRVLEGSQKHTGRVL
ncbi:unnamed protein product [Calypogeia fissa]